MPGREGTRPRRRAENVCSVVAFTLQRIGRASSMTDVQVTLSPSWVIEPAGAAAVSGLSPRRRVNAGSTSYLGCAPVRGGPSIRTRNTDEQWWNGLVPLLTSITDVNNVACVSGRERKRRPSVRLRAFGVLGRRDGPTVADVGSDGPGGHGPRLYSGRKADAIPGGGI